MTDFQEPLTTTVTLLTTVAECPAGSHHTVNPTFCSMVPSLRPQSISTTETRSAATPSISSVASSVPALVATTVRNALAPKLQISLWEKLGLENLHLMFMSIPIPDLTLSSAKEALTRYGRIIWEVTEYLLFS